MVYDRIVRPETARLNLSHGDWLMVKKRLNAGEQRKVFGRMVKSMNANEQIEMDPLQAGLSTVLAYLLDWSIPIPIGGKSLEDVTSALDSIDLESFTEIMQAVQAHEAAMTTEREAEKNGQGGGRKSSAISPSLVDVAGDTSGLRP